MNKQRLRWYSLLLLTARITNASRGTSNAWHFYYALVFVVMVLCGNLVVALSAP
ncbi:DUF3265 domain-containing protein [Vibrio sp. A14(2019)]|nr:DUF3265 domain-containing protein [Vibrio sp. A14(2019)]